MTSSTWEMQVARNAPSFACAAQHWADPESPVRKKAEDVRASSRAISAGAICVTDRTSSFFKDSSRASHFIELCPPSSWGLQHCRSGGQTNPVTCTWYRLVRYLWEQQWPSSRGCPRLWEYQGTGTKGMKIMQWCSSFSSAPNSQFILTRARWCMAAHGMKFDNRIYGDLAQIWSSQSSAHFLHPPSFFLIPSFSTHGNMQIRPVLIAEVFI